MTSENISEPWIFFEAGALSGRGCPYLLDIHPVEIEGTPLSQFEQGRHEEAGQDAQRGNGQRPVI
jgi:hypothetical protein